MSDVTGWLQRLSRVEVRVQRMLGHRVLHKIVVSFQYVTTFFALYLQVIICHVGAEIDLCHELAPAELTGEGPLITRNVIMILHLGDSLKVTEKLSL